jgi:hypothetical protein
LVAGNKSKSYIISLSDDFTEIEYTVEIENLNKQYNFDAKYSQLPYTLYNDEEVKQFYIAKTEKLVNENKKEPLKVETIEQPIKHVIPEPEVKPDNVSVTLKLTGKNMAVLQVIIDRIKGVPSIQCEILNV